MISFDSRQFDAALERTTREVVEATDEGLQSGAEAIGQSFRTRARVLSGEHRDSFRVLDPSGPKERREIAFGPTMVYSRRIERKFPALDPAMRAAGPNEVQQALRDAWTGGLQ